MQKRAHMGLLKVSKAPDVLNAMPIELAQIIMRFAGRIWTPRTQDGTLHHVSPPRYCLATARHFTVIPCPWGVLAEMFPDEWFTLAGTATDVTRQMNQN